MPFSAFSSAGVAAIQLGIVNTSGYPAGVTGALTTLTPVGLATMRFSKRFGGILPGPTWATAIGDNNRNIHEYAFNASQMASIALMLHALDMDVYAGLLKIKKFTEGNGNAVLIQSNAPVNAAQACVVVNVDSQIADAGSTFGLKRFINEIYSLCTITPMLGNTQEVNPVEWEYQGRPTQAGKLPWGVPFDVSTHGATRAGGIILTSDYPICIDTMTDTVGGATTMTLINTPATPAATYVKLFKDTAGVVAPLACTAVGKVLTFAALTAGDTLICRYESTDFIANL